MSAPPSSPGNNGDGEADNVTAGPPWMDPRNQYAQLTGLQNGIGIPRTSVPPVQPMHIYGAAQAPTGIRDMGQYYPYWQHQQLAFNHQAQVRAAIPSNLSQQAADMSRVRYQQPPETHQGGRLPPVNIGGYLALLAQSRAQGQPSQELETTNEGMGIPSHRIHDNRMMNANYVPPAIGAPAAAESQPLSQEKLSDEALKRKITEKIKEKLKKLKPNLNKLDHASVLRPMIREQERYQPPVALKKPLTEKIKEKLQKKKLDQASVLEPLIREQEPHQPSVSGKKTLASSTISQPQAKKSRTGGTAAKVQPATPKQISDSLDKVIDSLQDKNIRSALQEDRANIQSKRSDMLQIYQEQRDNMKSRLAMYTELQILSKLIAATHANSNAKNSRNNNRMDGAIDMIHLSLRNYRMLEDTSDRLLDEILRKTA